MLITGASTGIGRALAGEFARRGAELALGGHPDESDVLEDLCGHLTDRFGIVTWPLAVDLLSQNGPETLYHRTRDTIGEIFALVNNAGTVAYGRFWETGWAGQKATFDLNLYVPLRLMSLFLPDMVERGEGVVFNTSSVSALQPTPFQSVYGATKAGLQSLSQAVRVELKGTGVTVCTLNPPYTDTRLLQSGGYPARLRFYDISGKKRPEWVARKALRAFEKKKFMYVPGLWAWLIHVGMIKFAPRRLVDAVSRYFMQAKGS